MGEPNAELRAAASHTKGKRVKHTTTRWWNIPYCSVCLDHKRQFEIAGWSAIPLILLGLILWIGVTGAAESPGMGLLLGLPTALLGIWPYNNALNRARATLKPSCTSERAAVRYLDWHSNFHTLAFTSREYLAAFVAANRRKTMSDIREI
jgi:hypothetical protein